MFSRENTILPTQSLTSIFSPLPVSNIYENKESKWDGCCCGYKNIKKCKCCCCCSCCKNKNDDDQLLMKEPIIVAEYTFHAENPQRMVR